MSLEVILIWILIGIIAGWIAGKVVQGSGFGLSRRHGHRHHRRGDRRLAAAETRRHSSIVRQPFVDNVIFAAIGAIILLRRIAADQALT